MKINTLKKDELDIIIKECFTKSDFCRKLGIKPVGGNFKIINKIISFYNLDTSHFLGIHWKKGKHVKGVKHKTIEEICVENSEYTNTNKLKKRLIKEGYKSHKCEICGYSDKIELHHINGNPYDNRLENLQILCPNCHSKTPNFRGSNIKERIHNSGFETIITEEEHIKRQQQKKENRRKTPYIEKQVKFCLFCGKELKGKQYRNRYCSVECYREDNKGQRPTFIQLLNDFKELKSFLQVGYKYNVSDNSVRKWCKLYGLPIHTKEIMEIIKNMNI